MRTLLVLFLVTATVRAGDPHAALKSELRDLVAKRLFARALTVADAEIERHPECVLAWQYRAYALHRMGRKEPARDAYKHTLGLDEDNWWAWLNLGELFAAEGRKAEAVAAAEQAVRLNPESKDVRVRLSRIHREAGDYETALAAALMALAGGIDAAWCHSELGYLYWVLGNSAKAKEHWEAARKAGADREACDHGLSLVKWDRLTGSRMEQEDVARRRRGEGEEWVFKIGELEVRTRVGPALPREIENLLSTQLTRQKKILGVKEIGRRIVRLHLSRTREEHERRRAREFPTGYSGKAFSVPRSGPDVSTEMFVCWSTPGIRRSLPHELAHALLNVRNPWGAPYPMCFQEGIATYMEEETVRTDLLEVLRSPANAGKRLRLPLIYGLQTWNFTGPDARLRYAEAWSMVYFLVEGQKDGVRKLNQYLDGGGGNVSFEKIWGRNITDLNQPWREYEAKLK